MARKRTALKPGDHRATLLTRKAGDKLFYTCGCRCGWRGAEASARTSALDQFDHHVEELKRGG